MASPAVASLSYLLWAAVCTKGSQSVLLVRDGTSQWPLAEAWPVIGRVAYPYLWAQAGCVLGVRSPSTLGTGMACVVAELKGDAWASSGFGKRSSFDLRCLPGDRYHGQRAHTCRLRSEFLCSVHTYSFSSPSAIVARGFVHAYSSGKYV